MPVLSNILLIDDDSDDAALFEYVLEEIHPDCRLTIATFEPGAPNDLTQYPPPDIIVLDINMPYKSGKEWLDEIRSVKKYDQVPIIILSGHKNPSYIDHCLSHGADKYYIKPATLPAIKSMIAEICGITKGIIRDS
ncbi:MAG: response regulator [Bacteroidota bacterium]